MRYLLLYLFVLITFTVLDSVWLGLIAGGLYKKELGVLLSNNIRYMPAALFYIMYAFGVLYFCVYPAIINKKKYLGLINGFLFGLICYATFGLTNYAVIEGWSLKTVWVDLVWGSASAALTTFLAILVGNNLKKTN